MNLPFITDHTAKLVVLIGFLTLISCSTTTPVVQEAAEKAEIMTWNRVEVQAVESNATLAEEVFKMLATGTLRTKLDEKLEQERRKLETNYPEVAERDFILQLRIFSSSLGPEDLELSSDQAMEVNDLWTVKGSAEISRDHFLARLQADEEIWRVFQHSEWIQTLQ